MQQLGGNSEYNVVFACESDKKKQQYLSKYVFQDDDRCVFEDICAMGGEQAVCCVHKGPKGEKQECRITMFEDTLTMCICGWSCRDLSKMNKKFTNKANVLSQTGNTSQTTFAGLVDFLANHRPAVWIGENVDEMSKVSSDNRCHMMEKLGDIGYVVDTIVLDSSEFGAATARKRTWIVALQCGVLNLEVVRAREIIKSVIKLVPTLKVAQIPLTNFLLGDSDPYVTEAFEHAQKVHETASSTAASDKWKKDLQDRLQKKGLSWSKCKAPAEIIEGRWYSTLPHRERMVL
eukprot:9249358-Pyramimonas_sp.AAC.1